MTYEITHKHKNNESLSGYWGMAAIMEIGPFVENQNTYWF
jgi:hypothetical protein